MTYPTFTVRDNICRCDYCGLIIPNHWRAKQGHRCIHNTPKENRSA